MRNELPFVRRSEDAVDFWNVEPTGNYRQDFETGQAYARQLIKDIAAPNGIPAMLTWVVAAMPEKRTGIESGFLWEIAELAAKSLRAHMVRAAA